MRLTISRRPALAVLLLCLGAGQAAAGETDPLKGRLKQRLTTVDGLSHNSVRSILQDQRGFLWFGTVDGLNRYDGYEFRHYRHQPERSDSLPAGEVSALYQDSKGRIWIGLKGQISWMDEPGKFRKRMLSGASPYDDVLEFIPDSEGNLWIHCLGSLHRFRLAEKRTGSIKEEITLIHLFETEFSSQSAALQEKLPAPVYDAVRRRRFLSRSSILPKIQEKLSCEVELRQADSFWIGCNRGLYHFQPGQDVAQRLSLESGSGAWLQNYVRALYVDRSDTLWVGTQGGLYKFERNHKQFHNWQGSEAGGDLRDWAVSSILERTPDEFWLSFYGAGLRHLQQGQVRHYLVPDPYPAGCSNVIWDLEPANDGKLWLATETGICLFDPNTRRYFPGPPMLTNRWSQSLLRDDQDRLWINGYGVLQPDQTLRNLPDGVIFDFGFIDRESRYLWTAGTHPQISRINLASGDILHLRPFGDSGGQILVIQEDRQGRLWFGTSVGLFRIDPGERKAQLIDFSGGPPGSFVYSIEEDDRNRLWLGTNQGLVRLSFDSGGEPEFRHFDQKDGIASSEFNRRASHRGRDGRLYFGGMNGLTVFHPEQILDNQTPPPVVLTGVEYSNREETFRREVAENSQLTLSYHHYSVSFDYAALTFSNSEENRYRYRLDGFDPDWVEAGNERTARYTNLPAGRYSFRVVGRNSDGVWNLEGASLDLEVLPPFWETWSFRAFVFSLLAVGLYFLHRLRVRHVLQLERVRSRIAEDLHDDLSTNLSGIALASGVVKKRPGLSPPDREILDQIEEAARQSVDSVRNIVWMTDPEHDSLQDLVQRMKTLCQRMLPDMDWKFSTSNLRNPRLSMHLRRDLYLIFKEALHNAARHSQASRVEVEFRRQGMEFELQIRDDGIGFNRSRPGGHGLANMKRRASERGADLEVVSSPGAGTAVRLSFRLA